MKKRVIYFGSYHPKYSRNLLTKKAFKDLGWQVKDCQNSQNGLVHYYKLIKELLEKIKDTDLVFIGVTGHYDLPIAWAIAKIFRKKIIFDYFFSLYDTYINDRKTSKIISWNALRFYFYDWLSANLADKLILDTKENINYIINKYKIRKSKVFELPVTADPELFKFKPHKNHRTYTVGFYGSFMPLHGVDIIIKAAHKLKNKNIYFKLFGDGPGLKEIEKMIQNFSLAKKVKIQAGLIPYEDLPKVFDGVDLFLGGPFGESGKSNRVITTKTVEAMSVGVPVVVARSEATNRLIGSYIGDTIWVNKGKPEDLANVILKSMASKKNLNKTNYFIKSELAYDKFKNKLGKIILHP